MAKDYLKEIVKLARVSQPKNVPTSKHWSRVEKEIGYVFPDDYKNLFLSLGEGHFGANLRFENPACPFEVNRLGHKLLIDHLEWFKGVEKSTSLKFYPDKEGLIFIGHIDRNDFFYQPKKGTKKLSRIVWIDSDLNTVQHIGDPLMAFLYKLYMGLYPKDLFPNNALEDLRACIWHNGNAAGDDTFFGPSNRDRPFFTGW